MTIGAVILAGGGSTRMGRDKAGLRLAGESFLEHTIAAVRHCDEILISTDRPGRFSGCGLTEAVDRVPGAGPIGGLWSALTACASDCLVAVGCDMPLFTRGLAEYLCAFLHEGIDAVVAVTRGGRRQPLCAVYATSAARIFGEAIAVGKYSVVAALEHMRVREAPLCHTIYADAAARGVNTPEEYRVLRKTVEGPPVIAVSGVKNSGKTTLLEGIIPLLAREGLCVAAIKHDGHDFSPDVPGADSHRLRAAGACGVAVYSPRRYMVTEERGGLEARELAARFPEADLVLLEGGKHSPYPKLEVVRAAVSARPVCDPATLLAVCADVEVSVPGAPVLDSGNYAEVCAVILSYLKTY